MEKLSVCASLSRLVFKAAIGRAATAKLQGRYRLLSALKAIRDGLRVKPSACLPFRHCVTKKRHVSLTPASESNGKETSFLSLHITLSTR